MKDLADSRILLVDDAKANLDILVEGLRADYKLSLALNGEMALQIAARTPPDLVLLDIQMPGMDGYEVCRRLRGMPETAEVPIVFLSSLEEVRDKAQGFDAGANDYVTKPFELLEVKARVRSLLKAKAYNDAVKERIAGDLRVAREIQMGMLPRDLEATGRSYGVELAALLEPAREVGGDLYGVYAPAPERLVIVMGDVSGKGIPAALFMMRTCTMVHLLVKEIVEPERILARLNDELAADNPSDMFVTLLCAVYEPATGRVVVANGGHCRPVLARVGARPGWAVERLGTALGFETGITFERTELELEPGDALILYTDGVIEAFDPGEECYGGERLIADVHDLSAPDHAASATAASPGTPSAAELAAGLLARVRAFSAGAPQSDDIAILALRAAPAGEQPHVLNMELRGTLDDVMRGVDALREFGRVHEVPEQDLFALALALEESATNLVRHALAGDAGQQIRLSLELRGDTFTIELRDRGLHFDPTLVPTPEPRPEDDGLAEGGWGVHLTRHYTDDIHYAAEGDDHVLRLTRRLTRDGTHTRDPAAIDGLSP